MWAELPSDVLEELSDPEFENRTHGVRGTYARGRLPGSKGCRGPLCRKAERDEADRKYKARQAKVGKVAKSGLKNETARARDELLTKIILWHAGERELARLNRLVQPDDDEILEETA
jgi:hypothetical protein